MAEMKTEADRLRSLQDRLLKLAHVKRFVEVHGRDTAFWEGGPSAAELEQFIFPGWEFKMLQVIEEYC